MYFVDETFNKVRIRRVHLGKARKLGRQRPFTKGTTTTTRENNYADLADVLLTQ